MKKKSLTSQAKENGWPTITSKIDIKFEKELVNFLKEAKAPQTLEDAAARFSKPVKEVEHYLERLNGQKLITYLHIGGGKWGWVAVSLERN